MQDGGGEKGECRRCGTTCYVSSCYYMCPHAAIDVSSSCYVSSRCVLMLLFFFWPDCLPDLGEGGRFLKMLS